MRGRDARHHQTSPSESREAALAAAWIAKENLVGMPGPAEVIVGETRSAAVPG